MKTIEDYAREAAAIIGPLYVGAWKHMADIGKQQMRDVIADTVRAALSDATSTHAAELAKKDEEIQRKDSRLLFVAELLRDLPDPGLVGFTEERCRRLDASVTMAIRELESECQDLFPKYVDSLRAELATARRQIEMDTECIERIRIHGLAVELELATVRAQLEEKEHRLRLTNENKDLAFKQLCDLESRVAAARDLLALRPETQIVQANQEQPQ